MSLKIGSDFLKEKEEEKYSLLIKLINILVALLWFIAIFYMILNPYKSHIPTLLAFIAFTASSIPAILKKRWVVGYWVF